MKQLQFIHNRKTAGMSIMAFFDNLPDVQLIRVKDWSVLDPSIPSFAVKRNPYTRCLSAWRYCESTRDRSILDCLKNPPTAEQHPHDYRHFTREQHSWFADGPNMKVDFLLEFEHISLHVHNLCFLLGIDTGRRGENTLDHLNSNITGSSINDCATELLSPTVKSGIQKFYNRDFITLGYDK